MKWFLIGAGALVLAACGVPLASADGAHILFVNGAQYGNTHEAGATFHWETPNVPIGTSVTFPERGQEWTGQGYQDCEGGLAHWISNENNLVQSGCVEGDTTTTTSTTTTTTSTTIPDETTTTTTCPDCTPNTVVITSPTTTTLPPGTPGTLATPPAPTVVTVATGIPPSPTTTGSTGSTPTTPSSTTPPINNPASVPTTSPSPTATATSTPPQGGLPPTL